MLGRLFKRNNDGETVATKAKLGTESTMYFDKDKGIWRERGKEHEEKEREELKPPPLVTAKKEEGETPPEKKEDDPLDALCAPPNPLAGRLGNRPASTPNPTPDSAFPPPPAGGVAASPFGASVFGAATQPMNPNAPKNVSGGATVPSNPNAPRGPRERPERPKRAPRQPVKAAASPFAPPASNIDPEGGDGDGESPPANKPQTDTSANQNKPSEDTPAPKPVPQNRTRASPFAGAPSFKPPLPPFGSTQAADKKPGMGVSAPVIPPVFPAESPAEISGETQAGTSSETQPPPEESGEPKDDAPAPTPSVEESKREATDTGLSVTPPELPPELPTETPAETPAPPPEEIGEPKSEAPPVPVPEEVAPSKEEETPSKEEEPVENKEEKPAESGWGDMDELGDLLGAVNAPPTQEETPAVEVTAPALPTPEVPSTEESPPVDVNGPSPPPTGAPEPEGWGLEFELGESATAPSPVVVTSSPQGGEFDIAGAETGTAEEPAASQMDASRSVNGESTSSWVMLSEEQAASDSKEAPVSTSEQPGEDQSVEVQATAPEGDLLEDVMKGEDSQQVTMADCSPEELRPEEEAKEPPTSTAVELEEQQPEDKAFTEAEAKEETPVEGKPTERDILDELMAGEDAAPKPEEPKEAQPETAPLQTQPEPTDLLDELVPPEPAQDAAPKPDEPKEAEEETVLERSKPEPTDLDFLDGLVDKPPSQDAAPKPEEPKEVQREIVLEQTKPEPTDLLDGFVAEPPSQDRGLIMPSPAAAASSTVDVAALQEELAKLREANLELEKKLAESQTALAAAEECGKESPGGATSEPSKESLLAEPLEVPSTGRSGGREGDEEFNLPDFVWSCGNSEVMAFVQKLVAENSALRRLQGAAPADATLVTAPGQAPAGAAKNAPPLASSLFDTREVSVDRALAFLSTITESDGHQVEALLNLLNTEHPGNVHVCSQVCAALENMTFTDTENRRSIVQRGGIEAIFAMIDRHQDSDSSLIRPAVDALWNLTFDDEAVDRATEADGIKRITATMQKHEAASDLQGGACAVLLNLAVREQNRWAIAQGDGVSLVVKAMHRHSQSEEVLEQGCQTLYMLAYHQDLRPIVLRAEAGGAAAVAAAYPGSGRAQKWGRWLQEVLAC